MFSLPRFCISVAVGYIVGYPLSPYFFYDATLGKPMNCVSVIPDFPDSKASSKSISSVETASKQEFIYVGVMSMQNKLDTRIEATINTWAKHPNVKVEIFSSNNGTFDEYKRYKEYYLRNGIRVIELLGVKDQAYPPQKKSFAMVKFMHDMYIDKYDWFIRFDDDAYLDIEKLKLFLARVNSSRPFSIGSQSTGMNAGDRVPKGDNYCMGGPGMVLSKKVLAQLAPKLKHCLTNLWTEHEDIELGRCITLSSGAQCSWALDAHSYFRQEYVHGGVARNYKRLTNWMLDMGITYHCNKDSEYQCRLHVFKLVRKITKLLNSLAQQEQYLRKLSASSFDVFKQESNANEGNLWSAIIDFQSYQLMSKKPKIRTQKMIEQLLNFSTTSYTQKLNTGKAVRNKKALALENSYYILNPMFSLVVISRVVASLETPRKEEKEEVAFLHQRKYIIQHLTFFNEPHDLSVNDVKNYISKQEKEVLSLDTEININFLLSVNESGSTISLFLTHFKQAVLEQKEHLHLIIVYFPATKNVSHQMNETLLNDITIVMDSINDIRKKFPYAKITFNQQQRGTVFSRKKGLLIASELVTNPKEILYFCDVHFRFSPALLTRIRRNTILKKQVYDPVFFSQYNPDVVYADKPKPSKHAFHYEEIDGFWWYFRDGVFAIYKSDFDSSLKNTDILEDDAEMVFHLRKVGLEVFRSPEPAVYHLHHKINCETAPYYPNCTNLNAWQYGPKTFLYHLYNSTSNKN